MAQHGVVVDDLNSTLAATRDLHEECVVAWDSVSIERIAVKINDWLVEHPGWRVKHQSLAVVPETDDEHPVYGALITLEKGRA